MKQLWYFLRTVGGLCLDNFSQDKGHKDVTLMVTFAKSGSEHIKVKTELGLLHILVCSYMTMFQLTFSEGTIIVINGMVEVYKIVKQDRINPKHDFLAFCILNCPKNSNK